jgi:thioredoxin-related protein
MKLKILLSLLLVVLIAAVSYGFIHSPKKTQEAEAINWVSIEEAAELAPQAGKKILVDVYTDWCGWCKRMDKATYEDPQVAAYINEHYLAVKFNAEQKAEINLKGQIFKFVPNGRRGYHELAASLLNGQMSYPHTVFLEPDLNLITRIAGYKDANFMLPVLHYLGEGAYKENVSFQDFLSNFKADQ